MASKAESLGLLQKIGSTLWASLAGDVEASPLGELQLGSDVDAEQLGDLLIGGLGNEVEVSVEEPSAVGGSAPSLVDSRGLG